MKKLVLVGLILVGSLGGGAAWADPIVSVDTDPGTAGIQSSLVTTVGASFTVDIVITGMAGLSGPPMEKVEFDLDFDPTILTANSISVGGFFSGGSVTENDVSPPDVNFAFLAVAGATVDETQPLASIEFTAVGAGVTDLDLNDVVLSDRDGLSVIPQDSSSPQDGIVTVTNVVPEPSSMLLFGTGLFGFGLYRFWRRPRSI